MVIEQMAINGFSVRKASEDYQNEKYFEWLRQDDSPRDRLIDFK